MEGEGLSEMSIHIYDTTQHHIPEDTCRALFPFSSIFRHFVSRIFVRTQLKHPARDTVPWNQHVLRFLLTN